MRYKVYTVESKLSFLDGTSNWTTFPFKEDEYDKALEEFNKDDKYWLELNAPKFKLKYKSLFDKKGIKDGTVELFENDVAEDELGNKRGVNRIALDSKIVLPPVSEL